MDQVLEVEVLTIAIYAEAVVDREHILKSQCKTQQRRGTVLGQAGLEESTLIIQAFTVVTAAQESSS